MDFSLWFAGAAAVALIFALVVIALAIVVQRLKGEVSALAADKRLPEPKARTTAWGRFFDRWEWKPMRLPLLIVVVLAVHLLAQFQGGLFGVFKTLLQELRVDAQWWDVGLLFGFFGASIAVLAGGIMAVIAICGNLSTDSPPPAEGVVPQSTVTDILKRDEANAEAIRALATGMTEIAQSFRAALPAPAPAPSSRE